jgi:hypothetical protein
MGISKQKKRAAAQHSQVEFASIVLNTRHFLRSSRAD